MEKVKITIEMEIPKTCGECMFYQEPPYQCHNERGTFAHCSMGYMYGDRRGKSFRNIKYRGCKLGLENPHYDRELKKYVEVLK